MAITTARQIESYRKRAARGKARGWSHRILPGSERPRLRQYRLARPYRSRWHQPENRSSGSCQRKVRANSDAADVSVGIEKEAVPGNATGIEGGVEAGEAFAKTVRRCSFEAPVSRV